MDGNYTRMLRAISNKYWKQHSTKQHLCGHLPPISKTIQVRQTRHCWRSKNEVINDILQWTLKHRCTSVGWPARTYLHQLCADTQGPIDNKDGWKEKERESGKSVLPVRHDDDDNLCVCVCVCVCVCIYIYI